MKIAIIGCGNMGFAYVKSLLKSNTVTPEEVFIFEKNEERISFLKNEKCGIVSDELNDNLSTADFIILAVKPQFFAEASKELAPFIKENQVLISIMAGVKSQIIAKALNQPNVVRAMPNTPCQIGHGITGYCYTNKLDDAKKASIQTILESTGKAIEVATEDQIDVVTALSGSGPAYFFYIVQQMVNAGVKLGMEEEKASLLVKETMQGAYQLMQASPQSFQELINAVTSKGGTTEAALNTFKSQDLGNILDHGLTNARNRAEELSEMIEL